MEKLPIKMIPFSKPSFDISEYRGVKKVLASGWVTQGPKVAEFEDRFSRFLTCKHACAVSSCTAALHLALLSVGVKPLDTVITVSHSFIATANAVRYCGANPVFVDIDLDTFNISIECFERFLYEECAAINGKLFYNKSRVAAILAVHQMGMPCDLGGLLPLARKFNIPIVEDAACAIGSEIKIGNKWEKIGKPHGDLACFSFHPRKLITTGEGGMVTTNNPDYDRKIRLLRHQGMSIPDTLRHNSKKILFEEYPITGYNYRLTDIQAAIGIAQLNKIAKLLSQRKWTASFYYGQLKNIPWLRLPREPNYGRCNWQSYPVRLLEGAPLNRNEIMQRLLDAGISTRPGIMNAHKEKPYASKIFLKNSELARNSVILLPIFDGIKISQLGKIVKFIKNA